MKKIAKLGSGSGLRGRAKSKKNKWRGVGGSDPSASPPPANTPLSGVSIQSATPDKAEDVWMAHTRFVFVSLIAVKMFPVVLM